MADAKTDTTIVVEDEGLVTVELPADLTLDDDEGGEPLTLKDLKDAAAGGAVVEPKTPRETVQRQPKKSAVDEASEALTASLDRERKARIASDQTAAAERQRADEATRIANETAEQNRQLQERANSSDLATVTTAIDSAKAELVAAKAAFIAAHDAGDASKMADAQERMGNASAEIKFNTAKKGELETAATRTKPTGHEGRVEAKPSGTPFERYVAPFSPKAQAWLRNHPDCVPAAVGGDGTKNSKMMAGHYDALANGLTEGSDEYFKKIEEHIGESDPVSAAAQTKLAGETVPKTPAPRQRQAQPSAPPSRDAPGPDGGAPVSRTVRLTPEQQEAALFSYPQNRGEEDVAWKKRALGTYAREYIAAKSEGRIGRLSH
jgi:hypothetical protein